jgi:hypothetical protein
MRMIRFITAAAAVVMAVGAAGAAAAQSAPGDTAGKPVSLLQVLGQPATATPAKPHAKYATRHTRRWTKRSHEHATETAAEPDPPATDAANASPANTPAASAWASDAAPLPGVATDATAPTVIPAVDQNLSELVVGGRTVQIATPDEANAIDLAADHQTITSAADPQAAAAAQAPAVALVQPDDPQRDTWYEELLATLGGALAAGLVAWFVIMGGGGSQPRMYG